MPRKLNFGSVLLADYVAQGHANKITIVNAYSGDVILNQMPSTVGFGIYLELNFREGIAPESLGFEIVLDDKKVVAGRAAGAIGSGDPATIAIPYFSCTVERETFLELYVTADGYARTRALRKAIRKGPIP